MSEEKSRRVPYEGEISTPAYDQPGTVDADLAQLCVAKGIASSEDVRAVYVLSVRGRVTPGSGPSMRDVRASGRQAAFISGTREWEAKMVPEADCAASGTLPDNSLYAVEELMMGLQWLAEDHYYQGRCGTCTTPNA